MAEVKKMAHSSAATPEQAGRENHWKGDVSHQKHTTQGPGGQRKIADLLSYGQENAIPRRHLEKLTGLDGRTVRLMIERERHEGVPILAIMSQATIYPPQSTKGPPASAPCATGPVRL